LSAGQSALTVIPDGSGQVTTSPRANRYSSNQSVILTALPGPDQSFLSWSGDASGAQNPLVISMSQSRLITAHFTRRPLLAVGGCVAQANRGPFQLLLTGQMGKRFEIDRTTDLNTWTPLVILTNAYGTVQYNDPSLSNQIQRFYRGVPAPN
jgi:hypothetical protein